MPERLDRVRVRVQSVKKEVVLCIDQSGSMAASVVYVSGFRGGAGLDVVDQHAARRSSRWPSFYLTDQLYDPVDVLFGTQLGGGTDINGRWRYGQLHMTRPETVVVLISDLYEVGIRQEMLKRVAAMKASGVQFVTLLALSDDGRRLTTGARGLRSPRSAHRPSRVRPTCSRR
ncbi:VWA domain-containing protein OS=Streptomyces fumanus OX=67302 GN=GCM10018772_43280 PE=4 SV=1 [Streptomyces fumanus]